MLSSTGVRYQALRHGRDTLVRAVRVTDHRVLAQQVLSGRLGIPVAARTVHTGLSADGRTLVLSEPLPPGGNTLSETKLAVLSTALTAPPRRFTLPGTFSVDAISPDGRWVYLIQRRSRDFTDYAVRAFDARRGELLPGAIVDKSEPGPMHGYPIDRATTDHGRMALTLYAGLGKESFVHALDTVRRSARCLDLPKGISAATVWQLRFGRASGSRLLLSAGGAPVAILHLDTLRITRAEAS